MLRVLQTAFFIVVICGCAGGPFVQRVQFKTPDDAPSPVSTVYRVTADVRPESLWVRAQVEIDYQNITTQALTALTIAQCPHVRNTPDGESAWSRIENLEVNGTPVSSTADSSDRAAVFIPLSVPLGRDERAAISFTLIATCGVKLTEAQGDHACLRFINWLPRVSATAPSGDLGRFAEWADFEIAFVVDSGWMMVAPGELLNDKELLGMLPNHDTVIIDAMNHPYTADGYTFSRLPSSRGRDRFAWSARHVTGFDFMLLRGYLLDRGRRGKNSVEVYYPPRLAEHWGGSVLEKALKLLKTEFHKTGRMLSGPLRIVAAGKSPWWFAENLQTLPPDENPNPIDIK